MVWRIISGTADRIQTIGLLAEILKPVLRSAAEIGAVMADDEGKGFVIRDRRGRGDDTPGSAEKPAASASEPRRSEPRAAQAEREAPSAAESAMPVTFSSFAFSLGTSALMLMGEQLDPHQERIPVNLIQAKEIIDILSMLEEKTRGNLTAEEQRVMTDMLYALRMKYVALASPGGAGGPRGSASP